MSHICRTCTFLVSWWGGTCVFWWMSGRIQGRWSCTWALPGWYPQYQDLPGWQSCLSGIQVVPLQRMHIFSIFCHGWNIRDRYVSAHGPLSSECLLVCSPVHSWIFQWYRLHAVLVFFPFGSIPVFSLFWYLFLILLCLVIQVLADGLALFFHLR